MHNDIKPFSCQKCKTQYDNQSVITNTTVDLTQSNDTGWKEELAFLIKNNNSKLLATVDGKKNTANRNIKRYQLKSQRLSRYFLQSGKQYDCILDGNTEY